MTCEKCDSQCELMPFYFLLLVMVVLKLTVPTSNSGLNTILFC